MKKITVFCSFLFAALLVGSIVLLNSCRIDLDSSNQVDEAIANSPEMEDYVIAAVDMQQAINALESNIKKVDFRKLKIEKDSLGRYVIYLHDNIGSFNLEEKINSMNQIKAELQRKHPEVASFNSKTARKYFNFTATKSVRVNAEFSKRGVGFTHVLTRLGNTEDPEAFRFHLTENWESFEDYMSFLASWMTDPNYVEAYMILYLDGTQEIFIDDRNTRGESYLDFEYTNGRPTRYGRDIFLIAHTHQNSWEPSDTDLNVAKDHPGITQGIYYKGGVYVYNLSF